MGKSLAIVVMLVCYVSSLGVGMVSAADKVIIAAPSNVKWAPCDPKVPAGCQFVVVQGDLAKGPAVQLVKAPAGHVFPPHRHSSTPEHITMISGSMLLGYDGGVDQYVGSNAYLFIGDNLVHWARCLEPCVFSLVTTGPFDLLLAEKK